MPKIPIDYSKTIIYKIEHIENDNLVYVGFTTNWDRRKCCHKSCCNSEKDKNYNRKLYQLINENGGWEMFRMIEIEKYPCIDRREAERRETECMKELKANLNAMNSYVSEEDKKMYQKEQSKLYYEQNKEKIKEKVKEYREDNKEKINEKHKQYRETSKDEMKEYLKEYRANNKDKRKEYDLLNKERIEEKHKQYCERNKDKLNEMAKRYREENKEKIKEQRRLRYQKRKEELKNNNN